MNKDSPECLNHGGVQDVKPVSTLSEQQAKDNNASDEQMDDESEYSDDDYEYEYEDSDAGSVVMFVEQDSSCAAGPFTKGNAEKTR